MSSAATPSAPAIPQLDLADIQGIILRSYRMPFLRMLLLRCDEAAGGRALLRAMTDGQDPLLRIR